MSILGIIVTAGVMMAWSTAAVSSRDVEAYSVYLQVLKDQLISHKLEQIVISSETTRLKRVLESVRTLDNLDEILRSEFLRLNAAPVVLEADLFAKNLPVVLLSTARRQQLFSSDVGGGWRGFYEEFPKSQGITELSRVAFDKERTTALVYSGTQRHGLDGGGFLFIMKLQDGVWKLHKKMKIWAS